MFRTMRRFKQQISKEECIRILQEEKRGILSMHGEDGYAYGIPMNHWYNPEDGKLYFHGAKTGHKIDAITKDNRVSYCVHDAGYRQAVKDYEKAQKQVNALEEEAVKALTGESQLDLKVVNAMLLKHREKLEAAQREMEETRNRVEQEDQNKKATKAQVDELRTWGEIYDGAKAEIRHMIIGRLVERIDVEEGNKITIKYRVSFEQFMNKEQASA